MTLMTATAHVTQLKCKRFIIILISLCWHCKNSFAQYKAVATNLNTNEQTVLPADTFYFGLIDEPNKIKSGKIMQVKQGIIVINNQEIATNQLAWINDQAVHPVRINPNIQSILLYFGGGIFAYSLYEYSNKNTDTAIIAGGAGLFTMMTALAIKFIPPKPLYDFTTSYLLETIQDASNP